MSNGRVSRHVEVAIIGAGTAGLAALSQVRRVTADFVLLDGGELGTTCARVGCMPSKAFIQAAGDFQRRRIFRRLGIEGADALRLDHAAAMEHVRDLRDIFVDRVLAGTTDNLGDEFIGAHARFVEPNVLEAAGQRIRADKVVIATGSSPVVPEDWRPFRHRVLTSDNFFEQETLPASVAVVGLGVIGLELGQALSRMGVAVTGLDALQYVGAIHDPVVNQLAVTLLQKEFRLWLGEAAEVREDGDRLRVASGDRRVHVDKVLACMGRRPNLQGLGLERIGVTLDTRGTPVYDPATMQIDGFPIFIAGDADADRQILHEASDEGRAAGGNAMADPIVRYRRRTPLTITFTDPNIASTGVSFRDLNEESTAVGEFRFNALGRALIMGRNQGILRLYADRQDGRLRGACMIAPGGEHLAHLLAWAIQQRQTVANLLQMPFYHPSIEEGLQAALRDVKKRLATGKNEGGPELMRD